MMKEAADAEKSRKQANDKSNSFDAYMVFVEKFKTVSKKMADNYLEKKMEAYRERKAAEQKAKQAAWKKRMDAYRKKMAENESGK